MGFRSRNKAFREPIRIWLESLRSTRTVRSPIGTACQIQLKHCPCLYPKIETGARHSSHVPRIEPSKKNEHRARNRYTFSNRRPHLVRRTKISRRRKKGSISSRVSLEYRPSYEWTSSSKISRYSRRKMKIRDGRKMRVRRVYDVVKKWRHSNWIGRSTIRDCISAYRILTAEEIRVISNYDT